MKKFFSKLIPRFPGQGRGRTLFTKRQEFVIVSTLLTIGLLLTQLLPDYRYPMTIFLACMAYIGSAIVLRADLAGIEFFTLLILPTLYTAAVTLFYFLLPLRWITRIPVVTLYILGMYALLLTENIYNVAANRTIALLRAAHTIGFLITLVTYFLLLSTVLAFRLPEIPTALIIGGLSAILIFQILWAIDLTPIINPKIRHLTLGLVIIFMELSWVLCFWSVKSTIKALFLTTCFYSLVGMTQQYLAERLYKKTIIEFSSVIIVVAIILFLTTNWRGNF
jgi:hypothetical protein